MAVAAKVTVAEVIGEDDDDVRTRSGVSTEGDRDEQS